ncbi:hypothetical protein ACLB2K_035058 [Fragaria x ananassa]
MVVDLSTRSVVPDKFYGGHGYPLLTFDEQTVASELPLSYKPFINSVKKRGLNLSEVVCTTFSVGWFGEEHKKRVIKVLCYYIEGTPNLYMRPLEGISLVVDLDELKIAEYYDRDRFPVRKAQGTEYRLSKQKPPFGPRLMVSPLCSQTDPGLRLTGTQ